MIDISQSDSKPTKVILAVLGIVAGLIIVGSVVAFVTKPSTSQPVANEAQPPEAVVSGNASTPDTVKLLTYLIEEEKLAHDVYTKMYELWGARVFGNILQSESTHQAEVLRLLEARNVVDPRSDTIGVFNNPELQALYNKLITQGTQNATEAYKAGVAIEEKDIADINTQLETASDTDVIAALESLRRGSENHLRAFNRQL